MKQLAPLALCVLMITACQSGPSQPSEPDILIASDFPVSDPGFSVQQLQAIQLAIHQQNDHIGRFKLGYLSFDNHLGNSSSQPKGIQNVKQMIADARVLGMVGPWTSNIAYGDIPVANLADLAMVSPANTGPCITQTHPFCHPGQPPWKYLSHPNNYFRIAAPEPLQGRALARYISESLGVKRVAAFNEFGASGDLYVLELGRELARTGGKLVLTQQLAPNNATFQSFVSSARAAGAQAIFGVGSGDEHACAVRAQMPKGLYFMGVDSIVSWTGGTSEAAIADDPCIKDAAGNGEGMLTATSDANLTHNTDAASMNAVAAFRSAYPNSTDIATYMFATYDSARILLDAISRAVVANGGNMPTRAQVVAAVAQTHFQGVTGTYSFDAHGDALSPAMEIYRVENGHWVFVEPIDVSAR